jgi:mono/diheme cytochrome c family protein
MRIRPLALASLLLLDVVVACDRSGRDIAGKTAPSDAPASDVHPVPYGTPDLAVVRAVLPQSDEGINGEAVYLANCAACHQSTGTGIPGAFPPLVKSPYVVGDNVERMASIMLYGLQGPINVLGTQYNNIMLPLGGTLTDEQLAAVATYVRSAWGNSAGPVGPEVFAKMRTKWGTRGQFQIAELGEEK